MIATLAYSSFISFIISWILNIILLFLLITCPSSQSVGYRRTSFAFVIFDLLFSLSFAITVPIWHSDGNGLLLLIPVGYTSTISSTSFLGSLVRPGYILWHAGMIATSFLVATTFVYRYTVICDNKYLQCIFTTRITRVIVIIICTLFALTQGILLDLATYPIDSLTKTMNEQLSGIYGVNFSHVYYQGNDMTDPNSYNRALVGMGLSGLFQISFLFIIFVVFYTGRRIYVVIRSNGKSRRIQYKQQTVFHMLVYQALCPFLFLYLPPFIDATSILFGYFLPLPICIMKAIMVYLFPISNPLIIIIFTSDYRYMILRQLIKSRNQTTSPAILHNSTKKESIPNPMRTLSRQESRHTIKHDRKFTT